jgi:glycosyltransferase involved in cell wall biosynthesis
MRVLHLVHGSPWLGQIGGTELYVDALARATGQAVLCPRAEGRGLRAEEAPYPLFSVPRDGGDLGGALGELDAELIHVHHLAGLGTGLPRGLPRVLTLHDYSLICARGQLVDRHLELCPGPWPSRCARCVWSPGPLGHLRALAVALGARGVLRGAGLLAPSRDLAQRFGRLTGREVQVLDLPLVDPVDPAPEPPPGPLRFLFLGSLIPTKGPHILLQAFEGLEARLTLYGPRVDLPLDPGFFERLTARVEAAPNVRYEGVFGPRERQAILDGADVLVVPSTWPENSPLVVREALAAGLRVVASAAGGIAELSSRIRTVPPGDPARLREALQAEIHRGRGRDPARGFPMEPHLSALSLHYASCLRSLSS